MTYQGAAFGISEDESRRARAAVARDARERASDTDRARRLERYYRGKAADRAALVALRAVGDAVTAAVVDLHAPDSETDIDPNCDECRDRWPCETILVVAKVHGISTGADLL